MAAGSYHLTTAWRCLPVSLSILLAHGFRKLVVLPFGWECWQGLSAGSRSCRWEQGERQLSTLDLYPRIYLSIPLCLPRKRGGEWEPRATARMPLPVLRCLCANDNHV